MSGEDVVFLAHFTGWQLSELMALPTDELAYWYFKAVNTHNKLNRSE